MLIKVKTIFVKYSKYLEKISPWSIKKYHVATWDNI